MPEYNNTIRLGHKSVVTLQDAIRKMSSNAGKSFAAQWIRLATLAGEAQDAGIHKAILRRQYETEETICSCGLEAKGTSLDKTPGHLDRDGGVVDVILLDLKPEKFVVVRTACGTKRRMHKPLNKDDALVTSLRFRHRSGCVECIFGKKFGARAMSSETKNLGAVACSESRE